MWRRLDPRTVSFRTFGCCGPMLALAAAWMGATVWYSADVARRFLAGERPWGALAAAFWQIANPPERLNDAYAEEPDIRPPEWNIEFAPALGRVLTATCIGLLAGSK